jgi:hypothetical protein
LEGWAAASGPQSAASSPSYSAFAAVGLVLLVWKLIERKLLRKTLIEVSRVDYLKTPVEIRDEPYGGTLVSLAQELGYDYQAGETSQAFIRRIWGVDVDVEIDWPRE